MAKIPRRQELTSRHRPSGRSLGLRSAFQLRWLECRGLILVMPYVLAASTSVAQEISPPAPLASPAPPALTPPPPPTMVSRITTLWDETTAKGKTSLGVYVHEGVDGERQGFRPTRELRLSEQGSLMRDTQSLHWNLGLTANRDSLGGDQDLDEDYTEGRRQLVNGSVIGRGGQFLVRGLYWQRAEETWTLQAGAMQHIWGPADGINPLSVMNPQDLRYGLITEKDRKFVAIPSAKLSLNQPANSLSLVYAPWAQPSLLPERVHNYAVKLDQQNFETDIVGRRAITLSPSTAVKWDGSIRGADLTALFYSGVDYDPLGIPSQIVVRQNQPLSLRIDQNLPRKTSYGLGYNQTWGAWVLKAEGLYTPQKSYLPAIDPQKIENQEIVLPLANRTGQHVQVNGGFNYFTPIRSFFGIPLGETVVTAEYFRQRYFGKDLAPALFSDLILANLRTAALDDQLEINVTRVTDLALNGDLNLVKLGYMGSTVHHTMIFTSLGGATPEGTNLGSPLFYWRRNDSLAYEMSYVLK